MQRLAAVNGLVALVGSEGGMIQVRTHMQMVLLWYFYLSWKFDEKTRYNDLSCVHTGAVLHQGI